MKHTELGSTGIIVPRICIGCMAFGEVFDDRPWVIDQESTNKIIQKSLDLGLNFFDTANTYSHGTSEVFLGNALRTLSVKRENVVIATKVYFNEGHLSKEAILREIDGSLERLGTDYVDLYQIHRFDYDTPIEETMEALDSLIKAGKVRAIGASAMYGYQFHKMQMIADNHGWHRFETMQNHYNLMYREDERELIPICKEYGVSLIPYSPLAAGHLARREWESDSIRFKTDTIAKNKYDHAKENDMEIIERVYQLSEKYGHKMSEIALAWLLHKGAASPIIGPTKEKYLEDAVNAMEVELTEEDMNYLEEPYLAHEVVGALPQAK